VVTTPTAETRTLELHLQDWELIKSAISHEMKRWPPEHVNCFHLARLFNAVAMVCRQPGAYKTVRRIHS
jgi:hypothetical protein